ncbi:hypothetical protein [Paraburkholderia silvatlantica]|uniref:hypothetical protein n=1 Tax=Paraburkholderia silvatlantica TaxID=321895 RepID=UPI00105EFCC8|nr:hypothetical protein [Paraburkholderia silvatlantica]
MFDHALRRGLQRVECTKADDETPSSPCVGDGDGVQVQDAQGLEADVVRGVSLPRFLCFQIGIWQLQKYRFMYFAECLK